MSMVAFIFLTSRPHYPKADGIFHSKYSPHIGELLTGLSRPGTNPYIAIAGFYPCPETQSS
jgi:hypothetical protein